MDRNQAIELLHQYIKNENLRKHCYASEAVMRALAEKLDQDADKWAMAGLLHDLDVEMVDADPKIHGLETAKILTEKGVDPEIIDAIRMHNEEAHGESRSKLFHYALAAGETITGLIIATTLVYPDKKIHSIKPKSVTKRMKAKAFAASVNRETIMECEKLDIPLADFAVICVDAMKGIHEELGL